MLWRTLWLVALVALKVDGTPDITFFPSEEWNIGYNPTTENDFKDPLSLIRLSDKLCAEGNWALYTKSYWGANDGDFNTTLVYPIKGSSPPNNCATGVKSILSRIHSLRPLGVTASNVGTAKLTAFNKAYFLKEAEASESESGDILHDSTEKSANDVRSLAFVKELVTTTKSIAVCFRDSTSCMCYNEKADVMIPDVTTLGTKKQLVDCISKTAIECPSSGVVERANPKMCSTFSA